MDYILKFLCVFVWTSRHWLSTNGQFIKQPGDVALVAIPEYPLNIPCILKAHPFKEVSWEQRLDGKLDKLISQNRTFIPSYQDIYSITSKDPWDFSISILRFPSNEPQMRCVVMHQVAGFSHSSWSNINVVIASKPSITKFEADPQPLEDNFSLWCEVESNISSNITLVHLSNNSSDIMAYVQGETELKHSITSASCLSETRLKCLAENDFGWTEKTLSVNVWCRPRNVGNNSTIHILKAQELVWVDRKFVAYPKPDATCYSLMANGSSINMERDRYPLIEDGSHARYILRMFLTEADQTGLDTYQCVLSNTVGSTTIEFQVVTGISHTGNKSEDMEEPVNQMMSAAQLAIITGVNFVLLVVIAIPTIGACCYRRSRKKQTCAERTGESVEMKEVIPTPPVEETEVTQEIDIGGNSSSDTSSDSDVQHPHYVNEDFLKRKYCQLNLDELDLRPHVYDALESDYETITDNGYEIPLSVQQHENN